MDRKRKFEQIKKVLDLENVNMNRNQLKFSVKDSECPDEYADLNGQASPFYKRKESQFNMNDRNIKIK